MKQSSQHVQIIALLALAFQWIEQEIVVGKCQYGRRVSHAGMGWHVLPKKGKWSTRV